MGEVQIEGDDAILGVPVSPTLGYELTPSWVDVGRPADCWGSPGGGGVVTFVDPEAAHRLRVPEQRVVGRPAGRRPVRGERHQRALSLPLACIRVRV